MRIYSTSPIVLHIRYTYFTRSETLTSTIQVPIAGEGPKHDSSMSEKIVGDEMFVWCAEENNEMLVIKLGNLVFFRPFFCLPRINFFHQPAEEQQRQWRAKFVESLRPRFAKQHPI